MSKILLVDDEPHLLMAVEDTLLEEGFRVVTAIDGEQALQILGAESVDLVVSDVMMPGMDGFELCRRVRHQTELGSLPFIFLTALGQRPDQRQGRESGGDAYLVKPFEPEELISVIRASLKRMQQVQESLDPLIKQLRELGRLKDQHLAIASHEFKGTLTAIRGYAEKLLLHDHDLDTIRSHLTSICQESEGLAELVDGLLELSAFEHGRIRLNREKMDAAKLCEEVVAYAAEHLSPPRFRCQTGADIPCIQGDRQWLKRALLNLVQNAVKYAPQGDEVVIACRTVPEGVQILVQDQGIGLSPDHIARLGDWFYRVKVPATQGIPGSGLGLALVKRVILAHGGRFLVDSAPESGTRIGFVLPL